MFHAYVLSIQKRFSNDAMLLRHLAEFLDLIRIRIDDFNQVSIDFIMFIIALYIRKQLMTGSTLMI